MASHRSTGNRRARPRARRRTGRRALPVALAIGACMIGGTAFASWAGSVKPSGDSPVALSEEAVPQPQPVPASPAPSPPARTPTARPTTATRPSRSSSPTPAATPTVRVPASPAPTSPPASPGKPAPTPSGDTDPAQQVLALVNQARAGQNLPPYTLAAPLNRSAALHDQVMAAGCGLSHQCPGEPAVGRRETAQGVQWTTAGENIGEGGPVGQSSSAIAAMAVGLTQSMLDEKAPDDGHRRNLLSQDFTHLGIDVLRDPQGTVWITQDFSD